MGPKSSIQAIGPQHLSAQREAENSHLLPHSYRIRLKSYTQVFLRKSHLLVLTPKRVKSVWKGVFFQILSHLGWLHFGPMEVSRFSSRAAHIQHTSKFQIGLLQSMKYSGQVISIKRGRHYWQTRQSLRWACPASDNDESRSHPSPRSCSFQGSKTIQNRQSPHFLAGRQSTPSFQDSASVTGAHPAHLRLQAPV